MYNDMAQLWVRSSPGRAPPWHGGGSEFDPRRIHHIERTRLIQNISLFFYGFESRRLYFYLKI